MQQVIDLLLNTIGSVKQQLVARIEALETIAPVPGLKGADGARGESGPAGEPGPPGKDGRDGIDGKDGLDGQDGAPGLPGKDGADGLQGKDGRDGLDGKDGVDGKDGAPGLAGKDGIDGLHGKDGRDGLDGKDAPPITEEQILKALAASPHLFAQAIELHFKAHPIPIAKDGQDGRDGVSIGETFVDADGVLVITKTDGTIQKSGKVRGEKGQDGAPGLDGKDGLGFDDFRVDYDGDRTFAFLGQQADRVKTFGSHSVAFVLDRGIWRGDQSYKAGDGVTWGGSYWIAQQETKAKPGQPTEDSRAWRMAVKAGREGKQGEKGEKGDKGDQGPRGPQGERWK